ncbi:MAG: phospholipase [Solirubrobacteraceae bacterium]|nr:phospholipase [Solirubrobacteraceae bacterium]
MAPDPHMTRRTFVGAAAATIAGAALNPAALAARARRPRFDHVVVVMMENRSFDHLLGWLPGADGRQAGLTYLDAAGAPHATHSLAPDYQGCAGADPDHSYAGGRIELNGGACDGWLRAGANDDYALGYYLQADLSFLGQAVPDWTTFSRYFAPILAETYPNRIYQHAGQTDRIVNTTHISALPTIWDRLAERGRRGRYYFSDVPFLALWGPRHLPITRPIASFYADAAAGRLPDVAFVDPRFLDETAGTSGDDHPHGDIRSGEAFMARIYRAVTRSPNWSRTVLVFNFDEWGGFFEHVPPPAAPIPPADALAGNQDGLRGFRVPCLLVSPFAHRGHIATSVYDHTSILRMIESRWSLRSLTVRSRTANDLAHELTTTQRLSAPRYTVPSGPFGAACPPAAAPPSEEMWAPLVALARRFHFPL